MEFKNKYSLIACVNQNNAIGKDGNLLYHIKADLENFKLMTSDNVVIMGRKTFESLPNSRPLKNRVNIIITHNPNFSIDTSSWTKDEFNDTYWVNSLEEADDLCYAFFADKELFIIGGGQVYEEAYEKGLIDKAILTCVSEEKDGDTYLHDYSNDCEYKIIFKTTTLRDHPGDIYYKYLIYKKK